MFALSKQKLELSPFQMNFEDCWIYDLQSFHEFWKEKIILESKNNNIFTANTVWEVVLKTENLSLFSNLENLEVFSKKYHSFFKTKVSSHQISKTFSKLRRLGCSKIGNLQKLPLQQIQKRFGKEWRAFFEGVLFPQKAQWRWIPYREDEILFKKIDLDCCVFAEQILQESLSVLKEWQKEQPQLCFKEIKLHLISLEAGEDLQLDFSFTHSPLLKENLNWLERLFEERLSHTEIYSPVSRLEIELQPAARKKGVQLQLFENLQENIDWNQACEKLSASGFLVFKPKLKPSYLPEHSWIKDDSNSPACNLESFISQRPLTQYDPIKIEPPTGKLYFTERLSWMDEDGRLRCRDYFVTRKWRKWAWIFRDENSQYYEQGLIE